MSCDVGEAILQPFRRFTYVTAHSTTIPLLHLRHRHFTYVTWRATYGTYPLQCRTYNPNAPGLNTSRGSQTMNQNTRQEHNSGPPLICGQQNVRATAREHKREHKEYISSPRIVIKNLDPAELEGRDSTHHATATDFK